MTQRFFTHRVNLWLTLFLLLASHFSVAQEGTILTSVISFDSLMQQKKVRSVRWTNPDGRTETLQFLEAVIPMGEQMKKLTSEFNRSNYGIDSLWLTPRMIVVHSMDLGDLRACLERSSFLHDHLPADWGVLPRAGKLPNGAHFFVDREGTIYCLTPPVDELGKISYETQHHRWYIRRHADGNPVAIGIENVTPSNNDLTDLTALQVESNARLIRWLMAFEGGRVDHVTSHHQFNDEHFLRLMHGYYNLRYSGFRNRTTGRRDVGDVRLREILSRVTQAGWRVTSSFEK